MSVNLAVEGRSDKMRAVYLVGFNEVFRDSVYCVMSLATSL